MRKLSLVFWLIATLVSCKQQEDYKKVRDEVIAFHDLVMVDQEKIIANQMKLDSLLKILYKVKQKSPAIDTSIERDEIGRLLKALVTADVQMNNWMHSFEPDVTGKSNEDAVQYFRNEEMKIKKIDSVYRSQIKYLMLI